MFLILEFLILFSVKVQVLLHRKRSSHSGVYFHPHPPLLLKNNQKLKYPYKYSLNKIKRTFMVGLNVSMRVSYSGYYPSLPSW